MASITTLFSTRVSLPKLYPNSFPKTRPKEPPLRLSLPVLCRGKSSSAASQSGEEDFVTKVLKENPSRVEPMYRIGEKLYTYKERKELMSNWGMRFAAFLGEKVNLDSEPDDEEERNGSEKEGEKVRLKDVLREYRGKLYVPEQALGTKLTDREEFDKTFEDLPKMSFEEFMEEMKNDKVELLTSKRLAADVFGDGYVDFIVDLKRIPGEKNLQRTKWAMTLDNKEAQVILEEYKGPQYEIEKHVLTSVGQLREYPHPVASSISSRMLVELGMVTVFVTVAAALVGGFLASAVFAVTTFAFALTAYIVWPLVKTSSKLFLGFILGFLEGLWDDVVGMISEVLAGGFSKVTAYVTYSAVTRVWLLIPITVMVFTMIVLVRLSIVRKPKNFKKWDLWTGIEFGRSKADARVDGETGVKFSDVAGIDDAVEELQELVTYLKNPEMFDKMGIKPPHGVLLEGPPGCGKTLVAKAIAGESGVPFYQMAGSEFVEVLVGVGSARIRDLFKRAKVNRPAVIFVDEIDALGTRRQGIYGTSKSDFYNASIQEKETTLNQLLIELDGFDTGKGVIFIGATNRRDLLDPALLRPGRFDRKIRIRPPDAKGRLDILKIHARKVKLSESVDLATYANNLPRWTGAKLAQLLQEAALVAARQGHDSILPSDMDDAIVRLTIGPKLFMPAMSYEAQCRAAAIELGFAVTSHLLRRYEKAEVEYCNRVSIVPRAKTKSHVVFPRLDDELYTFERRPQLLHRLQVFLGGRAAEEVIYGRDTTKESIECLADASWLARKIITIWSLENPIVIHGQHRVWRRKFRSVGPRLDFEGSLYSNHGLAEPPLNLFMDDEFARRAEELVHEMYGKTLCLLRQNHTAFLKAIKVLLHQKEMSGQEIDHILDNYPPGTPLNVLLEEENPGSLPFFKNDPEQEAGELDYALLSESEGKTA